MKPSPEAVGAGHAFSTKRSLAVYDVAILGYFLDGGTYPSASPQLAVMDLDTVCLEVAARRVARYRPRVREANVLEPVTIEADQFDSIGMNHLLHRVPGSIRDKAVIFENLRALANPGASVFGATLLNDGVRRNWMCRVPKPVNGDVR